MRPYLLLTMLLAVTIPATATPLERLLRVRTVTGLARFIHDSELRIPPPEELLRGLSSKEALRIPDYSEDMPVREVFATIIEDSYSDELGANFHEPGKRYGVREICSFRTKKEELFRFTICIYGDRQYTMMEALLIKKLKSPKR